MSNIHGTLLSVTKEVKDEYEGVNLSVRGMSINGSGRDMISIQPRKIDILGDKVRFDFIHVAICGLVVNDQYDDNSPTGVSPTLVYNWNTGEKVIALVDLYRQLLQYVQDNGSGIFQEEIKKHNLRKFKPMKPEFDSSLIVDQLIIVAFLRFCQVLAEQKHPAMTNSKSADKAPCSLAKTSSVVKSAMQAQVSKPRAKKSAKHHLNGYEVTVSDDGSTIKGSNYKIMISKGTPYEDKPMMKVCILERCDGRMKQQGREEAFTRTQLIRVCYHYINKHADPVNNIDCISMLESAPDAISQKFEEFITDENGKPICIRDVNLIAALYQYAISFFPRVKTVAKVA